MQVTRQGADEFNVTLHGENGSVRIAAAISRHGDLHDPSVVADGREVNALFVSAIGCVDPASLVREMEIELVETRVIGPLEALLAHIQERVVAKKLRSPG